MNLLDHFHPPLEGVHTWESFHARWASSIADHLDVVLPMEYFTEVHVHFGPRIEVDVAALEREVPTPPDAEPEPEGRGGTAVLTAPSWTLTAPAMAMPAVFPDEIEVRVYTKEVGRKLVAAVELVSPGNKDRPDNRRGFAAKCAALLQRRIGLAIVDIVTDRHANLHNELVDLLDIGDAFRIDPAPLYTVSYGPARRPSGDVIDVWPSGLAVGLPMPVVPLPLDKGRVVPLDLAGSYAETCRRSRLS